MDRPRLLARHPRLCRSADEGAVRLGVVVAPILVGCAVILAMSAGDAAALTTQDEVTVDELVTRALADNPDVRAVRLDVEAAEGRLRQAGLRPNPMLDLGGQKALSPDNNLTVGVTVPLDLNGRKEGRVGVAEPVGVSMTRHEVSLSLSNPR